MDAGTGIREMGKWFLRRGMKHGVILMSHTHWDHISGFPFFIPAFRSDCHFNIMAGHLPVKLGIQTIFSAQMATPFFPVPLGFMKAKMEFQDFTAGDKFSLRKDIQVMTAPLNHPNGATGYRLSYRGKTVCYVTDTEHIPGKPDENILALIAGADLVIYDCAYTDDEFAGKIGWGHSTWQEGIRLCKLAKVKKLVLFHHDPEHDDGKMEEIAAKAARQWDKAITARENMIIVL